MDVGPETGELRPVSPARPIFVRFIRITMGRCNSCSRPSIEPAPKRRVTAHGFWRTSVAFSAGSRNTQSRNVP